MKAKKSIGSVINIKFNLVSPCKLNVDQMEMKSLAILIGTNGSGKTIINKFVFFSSFVTFIDLSLKNNPEFSSHFNYQYIFDNTFTNPEEFTGSITVYFENGTFECYLKEGIIDDLKISYDNDVNEGVYPKYMSTSTRLFSQMESILMLYKVLPEDQILKYHKLYDLMHCNRIKEFALNISNIPANLSDILKDHYDVDIVSLKYNEDTCQFSFIDSLGKVKLVSSLGSGHQSIINITLGVNY